MQDATEPTPDHTAVLRFLRASEPATSFKTNLSTRDVWFALDVGSAFDGSTQVVDFPSRHAVTLTCWDVGTDALLGNASRRNTEGQLAESRGGFALTATPTQPLGQVLCKAAFRGPAKLSAQLWAADALRNAQIAHRSTGVMMEAGIGMLALFMLLSAWVNRSRLYWMFVGWLLLNMRMAALSAGTDWELFGMEIDPSMVIYMRQWTICLYFSMTGALFSQFFKKELDELHAGWLLTALQTLAVAFAGLPLVLTFEQTLLAIWPCTVAGTTIIGWYLVKILRKTPSRVAGWYAASIAISALSSLTEVVAAATGPLVLLAGMNHVTAAIASAMLASLAMAEHMRTDRLEKIEAQKTLRAAYQDSPIGLFTVGEGGLLLKTNPAFQSKIKGIGSAAPSHLVQIFDVEVVNAIRQLQSPGTCNAIELQTKARNTDTGLDHWFSVKASTKDGVIVEGTLQDITERVRANERLEFMVNHDSLTDCLNLRGITRKFERFERQPDALAYFDLDRFKLINDLYGHTAGDAVLKQVCERIKQHLGPTDLLARMGGDECVVAFSRASMEEASRVCRASVDDISSGSYQIDTQSFSLSVSGGLVGTKRFIKSPLREVISAADTLCRIAKKRSGEQLVVMESGDRFFQQHKEELDLIAALERGETPAGLFLVMQPEISLTAPFESLNFEVLLRLRKANGQILPASIIIEAAEAHGKTAIIDRWVVNTTIDWLETHAESLGNTRFVGVNLSGGSLNDETFTAELFALFEQHPVAMSMICIEITETVALTDMRNMQRFIDRVRSIGAKVGLDDFGAGYSSFGYLKGLSVDALKLDGSLVRDAAHSPSGMAIVEAIAGLVNSLGMKSIGEFAENLATIKVLAAAGVDYAQGFGISRPVMPERILAASSGAEFIEDPEIMAFVRSLQEGVTDTMPLF
ncbi:MAG: EAL domain-containing protein [Burkholderiales bacterium]|nr:EAL domain-containing protein [Burkholderiales bacterium]